MLQEIIELQTNSVNKLIDIVEANQKSEYTFRAPTGSGKTFMMADFMNKMLQRRDDIVFLVSSLSKSDLAKQNYDKFCEYRDELGFSNINPYLINSEISGEERLYIPNDNNVYLLPKDLYKKDSRLMAGPFQSFLTEIRFIKHKSIVWIKDECHIATKNLDAIATDYFYCTVNFSATPKLSRGQHPDVEITDEEAENCKLIKRIQWGEEDDTVEDALKKFLEIKKDYRDLLEVNPCLIIQISNKNKADEELQREIMPALDKHPELKWMLIVDDPKDCDTNDVFKAKKLPVSKWKDYARSSDLSGIDVIIFKLVISEGWDIPRACMLFQTRNSRSKQLDEQVMGRVRRNPRLLDFENLTTQGQNLALTAWVWGVSPQEGGKSFSVKLSGDKNDIQKDFKVKTTIIKSLTDMENFDLEEYLSKQKPIVAHNSIFNINRQIQSVDPSVKQFLYDNVGSYARWWEVAEHIQGIAKESNQYRCNYEKSMEVGPEVSFADQSYYYVTDNYVKISNWLWRRRDGAEKFSFDSEAEKDWADELKDISSESVKSIHTGKKKQNQLAGETNLFGETVPEYTLEDERDVYMWGKNYVPDSLIKFEYYLGALHSSYPDFIMKDRFDRVHVFEVKSVNQSAEYKIDNNIYVTKVAELKKCYKQASKLTGQYFYLPIQREDVWTITMYDNGNERTLSIDQFRKFIKSPTQ